MNSLIIPCTAILLVFIFHFLTIIHYTDRIVDLVRFLYGFVNNDHRELDLTPCLEYLL
jgi:hypothetical protein